MQPEVPGLQVTGGGVESEQFTEPGIHGVPGVGFVGVTGLFGSGFVHDGVPGTHVSEGTMQT